MEPRFLTLTDVSETLNVTLAQTKALVRSGELAAIKIGGRGAWRVERSALEDYIERMYVQTRQLIESEHTAAVSAPVSTPVSTSGSGGNDMEAGGRPQS